ncbi:MAG: hypothetical protein Q9182_003673 [Xanthomendoza sp. 2 TL-2023]
MLHPESPSASKGSSAPKRSNPAAIETERPRKKLKALLAEDEDLTSDSGDNVGGAPLPLEHPSTNAITINEDFARRFEHNKRREELQKRLWFEERYGKSKTNGKQSADSDASGTATDSSTDSEEEDDDGILALGNLDEEVQATLSAIRTKDPRVYDKDTTFYTVPIDDEGHQHSTTERRQKPMYLSDYHRRNIMQGVSEIEENQMLPTYVQEQDNLKTTIVQEMHASGVPDGGNEKSDDEHSDDFLVPKNPQNRRMEEEVRIAAPQDQPDVNNADKDPEKFLSEFMSARAWIPQAGSRFAPFESDDEEEERRADEFEEAYNLRFEDPSALNEKLVSHARDAAARYSVRREALTGRKKSRESEKTKRKAEKEGREEDKARLRKLRIADAEDKVKKIKDAAGLRQENLNINDWSNFLEEGWDDERWENEMGNRFGDAYYKDQDTGEIDPTTGEYKSKIKKPKWEEDIAIDDLIPDFEEYDRLNKPRFTSSNLGSDGDGNIERGPDQSPGEASGSISMKRQKLREKQLHQKQAREERRQIEQLIDKNMAIDNRLADMGAGHAGSFRYRETSPVQYGLTAQDILMATDSQLNQYAGLKKLATFRDSTKKGKDRKRLGKKARLREWRKETFGSELGPQKALAEFLAEQGNAGHEPPTEKSDNIVEGGRRKKRAKDKIHKKTF